MNPATLPGDPEKPYTEEQKEFLAKQAGDTSKLSDVHFDTGNFEEARRWKSVSKKLKTAAETGLG